MSGYKIRRFSAAGTWIDIIVVDNLVDLTTYNADQATQDGRLTDAEAAIIARVTTATYDADQGVQDGRLDTLETDVAARVTTSTYTAGQAAQDGRLDTLETDVAARVTTTTYTSGQATQDGRLTDVENDITTITPLTNRVFANVAARNAAIPTPTAGMECWLTDPGIKITYDGSNWRFSQSGSTPSAIPDANGIITVTFPVAFGDVPVVTDSIARIGSSLRLGSMIHAISSSSVSYKIHSNGALETSYAVIVHWQAEGVL